MRSLPERQISLPIDAGKRSFTDLMRFAPTSRTYYFADAASRFSDGDAIERQFFSSIRLRNRVHKSTAPHRLDDVNDLVNPLLPRSGPLDLMDVAVSSGITTIEWSESLSAAGITHCLLGGDAAIAANLLILSENVEVLFDRTGYPLQLGLFRRGIPTSSPKRILDLPLTLLRLMLRIIFQAQIPSTDGTSDPPPPPPECPTAANLDRAYPRVVPLQLLCRRALSSQNVTFIEDDLLEPTPRSLMTRFHAVRAANILNLAYFSQQELLSILRHLKGRIIPGGLLIICRTDAAGCNSGSIFRLNNDDQLTLETRFGSGSDVDALANSLATEDRFHRQRSDL